MMRLRYEARCQECDWYRGPILFKYRAERAADRHFDAHELAFTKGLF